MAKKAPNPRTKKVETLYDIKRIAEEEGLVVNLCPVHRHADVKHDAMDMESIAFLEPTKSGGVQHDGICRKGVIAEDEASFRSWCAKQ
jgi:hypothetical protein